MLIFKKIRARAAERREVERLLDARLIDATFLQRATKA